MVAVVYAYSVQGPEYQWFTFFLLVLLIGILADGPAGPGPPMPWPDCSSASSSS